MALGLMSGTSGDGVSLALVSFKGRSFKLLAYQTFSYPRKIREKIARAPHLKIDEISALDFYLGEIFARRALKLLETSRIPRQKIAVIGSHGQTLYHGPRDFIPSTFQIGESAVIAQKTGIPVVSDFRPQDVVLGGEGAPLVPFFDHYFYGRGPLRAFQNIGGIANVTLVGRSLKRPIAFDTGPGNVLMDLAIQKLSSGKLTYDPSGRWARKGEADLRRIDRMMRHPYFMKKPPKSTGREVFGEPFLKKYLAGFFKRRPGDVLATLTSFTAFTIYDAIKRFAPRFPEEVIVSGGGAKNQTLMNDLRTLFAPVPIRSIEAFGIPAQAKEPMAFAFFALRALRGQLNHLPSVTGAGQPLVLGKITHPAPAHLRPGG